MLRLNTAVTTWEDKGNGCSLSYAVNQPDFQSSDWYRAITLTERIASLLETQRNPLNVGVDADLAERRIRRWRSQAPFTTDSCFTQRLARDGIFEDEFRHLLGESIETIHNRFPIPPFWLAGLAEAFSRPPSSDSILIPEALRGKEMAGFLNAIEPLIHQARNRVHEGVQSLIEAGLALPFDPGTIEDALFANLPGQLIMMLSRTMALELNVARLLGELEGDSTEVRFQSFSERLRCRDKALAILQEYPVLARQLIICIENWVTFSLEFLHNLCADWVAIRTTFSPENDPGVLVKLDGGAGDSHRGGRSVMIAKFNSGFQVVYKPKSLAVDVHFQELLAWLNEKGDHPPFRTLKVIDRGNYGWIEFVQAQGCTSPEEIQWFYERQGGYLALLYALEATDFHFENLIAAGEHPVLLDLEALFHPQVEGTDSRQADQLASKVLNDSVLCVGLLPQRIWSNAESEGIDLSGLGATAGQLTPFSVPRWEGVGTDEMRLTRKRAEMPGGHNRPTLNGAQVDVMDYAVAIATGFTKVYQLLMKHRAELLSDDGLLARFAGDEVRVILRATRTYGLLLHEGFHPDVLRNALDRDRLFDQLWSGIEHRPYLSQVIPAEQEDLWRNDIPMFTTRPDSRDLWRSTNVRIADFFDEPGIALVRRRLQQFSEDDLAQQLWIIRASLTALAMGEKNARQPRYHLTEPQTLADRERLLAAARAVGDRLAELALHGEGDVSWIGLTLTAKDHWALLPLGTDLYSGTPGVALFMAYLGAITREERYAAMAQAALTTIRRQVEQSKSYITSIGAFEGWGGIIYTLAHLSALWNQPSLLTEAEEIVGLLPDLIEKDEALDIIGGAAGCIGSLISLYRCAPSDRTFAAAVQCGDRLLACAQPMEQGIGWMSQFPATGPLAGFSHGAAGMAWALLELAALTGEERFRKAALAAIDYERSLFSPKAGNWPDLRKAEISSQVTKDGQEGETFMTAWCHGAPGIGLARLRSLKHLDDVEVRREIGTALRTTSEQGFGGNHSLCHGDLGNLELLLEASQMLDDPQWRAQVDHIAAMIVESIDKHGWLCGIPLGVESPGLMTGLAGIGYELLRLAEPTRVPAVMALDPPPQQQ